MTDPETIDVYNQRAAEYADLTDHDSSADPQLLAFLNNLNLPEGGHVLDLGCGPGASAAAMARAGLTVDAVDASAEMVALAARHPGVTARKANFEGIAADQIYDGIWANFSLLHAPRNRMSDHLGALHRALKPGGVFHIGMKLGEGSVRDDIGRLYTYYGEEELVNLLTQAGFSVTERAHGRDKGLDGVFADWLCLSAHG